MSLHSMFHVHKHHPHHVHDAKVVKTILRPHLFCPIRIHIGIHMSRETIYILTLSFKFSVTITAIVETSLKYQKIDLA